MLTNASSVYGDEDFTKDTQRGFIFDRDGDGMLSNGDTLVDLTSAVPNGTHGSITTFGFTLTLGPEAGGDIFGFELDQGDLSAF